MWGLPIDISCEFFIRHTVARKCSFTAMQKFYLSPFIFMQTDTLTEKVNCLFDALYFSAQYCRIFLIEHKVQPI